MQIHLLEAADPYLYSLIDQSNGAVSEATNSFNKTLAVRQSSTVSRRVEKAEVCAEEAGSQAITRYNDHNNVCRIATCREIIAQFSQSSPTDPAAAFPR